MITYPAVFTRDTEKGGFVVTFPDVPGCVTQGETEAEAREMAEDALLLVLSHLAGKGEQLPTPRPRRGRQCRQISLPPLASAKLELSLAFRSAGLRKAELARRMGIQKANVDRLFDVDHHSSFEQIEAAFRALGKRLVIEIREAS